MEMGIGRINQVMDDVPLDSFIPIAMTFARDKLDWRDSPTFSDPSFAYLAMPRLHFELNDVTPTPR